MLPVIVLVGRPNVGKSTLFNRLTGTRDALVADRPGLTRDRQYGVGKMGSSPYVVVDTGGLSDLEDGIDHAMASQARQAIEEADHLLFMVDVRDGATAADQAIADDLRRLGKPITLVCNKTDGMDADAAKADFFALGLGTPAAIAAAHGRGVRALIDRVLAELPDLSELAEGEDQGIKVAIVGRPNVGKSTLTNRFLGEERVIAFDKPGTTRDSIFIPLERDGKRYTLIDTAGVRRRARVREAIEKFSIIKTLQAIQAANVVLMVLDAQSGITDQDAGLAAQIVDSGRALVVAINKWDGLDTTERAQIKANMERKLSFLDFAHWRFVSALHGSGVGGLLADVDAAYAHAMADLATPELTELLALAVQEHQPPLVRGRRIKLRYAHQGGKNPPLIVVHGNQTEELPNSYERYLNNFFRRALRLHGTPIKMHFKSGENPFAGRRNKLTPRQEYKRKRMLRHVKGK